MNIPMKTLGAMTLLALSGAASAVPLQMTLTGTVTAATGTWSSQVGTAFTATLIFDLDEGNAYAKETISPAGEDPFTRWTFTGSPYQAAFSGAFGTLYDGTMAEETVNDFDADAAGNPYGVTGTVDAFSMYGSSIVVDCSAGTVDPVTGCSDPNAPWLYGTEFGVNLVSLSNWLADGNTLPGSIPAFNDLVGVFGSGEQWNSEGMTASLEVTYNSMTVSSVPVPAAAWLFGSGLVGMIRVAKRRKTA
jgi:hypothetical protein